MNISPFLETDPFEEALTKIRKFYIQYTIQNLVNVLFTDTLQSFCKYCTLNFSFFTRKNRDVLGSQQNIHNNIKHNT